MLSSFLHPTKTLFTREDRVKVIPIDITVKQQLRAEPASTVEDLMVTTRMQGQASVGIDPRKGNNSFGVQNMQEQPSAKRRCRSTDRAPIQVTTPTVTKSSERGTASMSLSYSSKRRQFQEKTDGCNVKIDVVNPVQTLDPVLQIRNNAKSKQSGTSSTKGPDSNTIETEQKRRTVTTTNLADHLHQRRKSPQIEDVTRTGTGKRKQMSRDSNNEPNAAVEPSRPSITPELRVESAVSVHKKFNSEEPEPLEILQPSNDAKIGQQSGSSAEDDSENDFPETLTVSAGLDQARIKVLEATKAASRLEAIQKSRRQKRDKRLRAQAKIAKKHRAASISPHLEEDLKPEGSERSMDEEKGTSHHVNHLKWSWSSGEPLPLLLPDEILAAEPITHLPTPPSDHRRMTNVPSKNRKLLEAETKPPADIIKGPVRVRVLEVNRGTLPPKASKSSKIIRESWLTGRNASMHRRKIGTGFIRR